MGPATAPLESVHVTLGREAQWSQVVALLSQTLARTPLKVNWQFELTNGSERKVMRTVGKGQAHDISEGFSSPEGAEILSERDALLPLRRRWESPETLDSKFLTTLRDALKG
jgi:hypothetical protein